jgi:hypothetical protein
MSDFRPDAGKSAIDELRERLKAEGKYTPDVEAMLKRVGADLVDTDQAAEPARAMEHAPSQLPPSSQAQVGPERVKIPRSGPPLDVIAHSVFTAGEKHRPQGRQRTAPLAPVPTRIVDPSRKWWVYLGIGTVVALIGGVAFGRMLMTEPVRSAPPASPTSTLPTRVTALPEAPIAAPAPPSERELTVETPVHEPEWEVQITPVPAFPTPLSSAPPKNEAMVAEDAPAPKVHTTPEVPAHREVATVDRATVRTVKRESAPPRAKRAEPTPRVARRTTPSRPKPSTSAPPIQQPDMTDRGLDDPDWLARTRPQRGDLARLDVPDGDPLPQPRSRRQNREDQGPRQTRLEGRRQGEAPGEDEDDIRKTVRICVETGWLATRWCPHTALLNVSERKVPTRVCRVHIDADNRR